MGVPDDVLLVERDQRPAAWIGWMLIYASSRFRISRLPVIFVTSGEPVPASRSSRAARTRATPSPDRLLLGGIRAGRERLPEHFADILEREERFERLLDLFLHGEPKPGVEPGWS
ncbi:hypothetical protein [Methanoculleus chikugoensis]|uniref:hypothetical protein n=1 Tax=Methanoculleus chikugoensis TaxID=118126 RepID=UPI001FB50BBF|nr:hypothetical protein [Methanoculleus chikugoensis]